LVGTQIADRLNWVHEYRTRLRVIERERLPIAALRLAKPINEQLLVRAAITDYAELIQLGT
jgi:hypothetical protein